MKLKHILAVLERIRRTPFFSHDPYETWLLWGYILIAWNNGKRRIYWNPPF